MKISSNALIQKSVGRTTKTERFLELLLMSGNEGVKRFTLIGKLKTTNPGGCASALRKEGINITTGNAYTIKDSESFILAANRFNDLRKGRNKGPIDNEVLKHWFDLFNFNDEIKV